MYPRILVVTKSSIRMAALHVSWCKISHQLWSSRTRSPQWLWGPSRKKLCEESNALLLLILDIHVMVNWHAAVKIGLALCTLRRLSQSRSLGFLVWCGRTRHELSLARASRSQSRYALKSSTCEQVYTLRFCFPTKMLHLKASFFPQKCSVVPKKVTKMLQLSVK